MIEVLLKNLATYVCSARAKQAELGAKNVETDRKKLMLVNSGKYSHHEEVDERLQFLKYVAQMTTDYQISQAELG